MKTIGIVSGGGNFRGNVGSRAVSNALRVEYVIGKGRVNFVKVNFVWKEDGMLMPGEQRLRRLVLISTGQIRGVFEVHGDLAWSSVTQLTVDTGERVVGD